MSHSIERRKNEAPHYLSDAGRMIASKVPLTPAETPEEYALSSQSKRRPPLPPPSMLNSDQPSWVGGDTVTWEPQQPSTIDALAARISHEMTDTDLWNEVIDEKRAGDATKYASPMNISLAREAYVAPRHRRRPTPRPPHGGAYEVRAPLLGSFGSPGAASGASAEAEDADAPLVHVRSEIVEGSGGSSGIPAVRLRIMDPAALQQLQSSLEAQRAAAGAKRVLHIPRQRLPSAGHRRPLFDHIKARGGEGGRSPHSNLVPGLGLIPSDSGHHLLRGVLATNRTPERLDGSLRFLDKFEIRRDSLGRPL